MADPGNQNTKIGRPSKYDPKYCEEIVEFFSGPAYVALPSKNGIQLFGNDLPLLSSFAARIGVHRDTLHEWAEKFPDFSDALKRAKDLQEQMLVTNGLKGLYNPSFAVFAAKNILGWRDRPKEEVFNETTETFADLVKSITQP